MSETICPHCRNLIYDEEALLCHFCGGSLNRASGGAFGRMRSGSLKWIVIMAAVLVVLAMALMR